MTAVSKPGPLFVGVDGGGTGCRARVEDAEGSLLGTGIAGPAALRLGVDRALSEVEKACRVALDEAGLGPDTLNSVHAAVGLAGIGRKGLLEERSVEDLILDRGDTMRGSFYKSGASGPSPPYPMRTTVSWQHADDSGPSRRR